MVMNDKKPAGLSKLSADFKKEAQDDLYDHIYSKENEQRRKRGLPELPYHSEDNWTEEQKVAQVNKRKEALKKVMALYFKRYNKENKNE